MQADCSLLATMTRTSLILSGTRTTAAKPMPSARPISRSWTKYAWPFFFPLAPILNPPLFFYYLRQAQLVELPNGQVMANMRNNHLTDCDCRAVALSNDGGASFEPLSFDPVLVSPVCQATIIRAKDDKIYFANPASKSERAVGTLRRSDDGHTWAASTSVWPDQYAYSCLTDVAVPNAVGLLFETNSTTCDGPSCRILFSIYDSSF